MKKGEDKWGRACQCSQYGHFKILPPIQSLRSQIIKILSLWAKNRSRFMPPVAQPAGLDASSKPVVQSRVA